MFENTSLLYLCTILEAIEKIEIYKHDFENGTALMEANDQMNFNAICRLLLAVGEESKKIDANLLALQPQIDWNAIIGLRNRMAHDYRGIDADIVFDIITKELFTLKEALMELLPGFSVSKSDLCHILASDYFKHIQYISLYLNVKD